MFKGKVISGGGKGKFLGYPTANLDTPKMSIRLGAGIYAAYATCRGQKHPAALVIQDNPWKVEVHFLLYDGQDCYGRVVQVDPVQKVGEIERQPDMEELKKKIHSDMQAVKRLLKIYDAPAA